MKTGRAILSIVAAFAGLLTCSTSEAVDTRLIDEVRKKQVLDSRDMQIIDDFLSEAVLELVKTRKFDEIATIRGEIVARRSNQGQYAQQFSESALKHISSGFQRAATLPDDRRIKVTVNLLILVDQLTDLRLVDLPLARLADKNTIIRYWAVHCLTNPRMIAKLNTGGTDSRFARLITERLSGIVESSVPEVLVMIAGFAGRVTSPQAEQLLLQVADQRIKRYAGWSVKRELIDASILKILAARMGSGGPSKSGVAQRFGQLYSYVLQRYVKGTGLLTDKQKRQLASVLVETEEKCIGTLLGRPQAAIRRAVEQDNYAALQQEHDRLFGNDAAKGELAVKLRFDYLSPRGAKRMAPLPLPVAPAKPRRGGQEPNANAQQ
ncbi:MAG: hypothetical protein JSU94_03595 [Phycisphaerales bacterium]|nr:MAG: hypothetical protein JSU94_03595 [Phycisphaerales bacterium]